MKQPTMVIIFVVTLLVAVGTVFLIGRETPQSSTKATTVESFAACQTAGYKILESFPRQCETPEGKVYVEELKAETQESMSRIDPETNKARNIIVSSPEENTTLASTFRLRGIANVSGNKVAYRLKVTSGRVITQGEVTVITAKAGGFGAFDGEIQYPPTPEKSAILEVFNTAADSANELNTVAVPVTLQ